MKGITGRVRGSQDFNTSWGDTGWDTAPAQSAWDTSATTNWADTTATTITPGKTFSVSILQS